MSGDFLEEWQDWHARREERLTAPLGYLAITGLHWLDAQPQRFEDVPGEWRSDAGGVEVRLSDGETLVLDGRELSGRHLFEGLDETGVRAGFGDRVVEIAERGGSPMLRPRHPDHALRAQHVPTPTYPPSPEWQVAARFEPYPAPEQVPVDTVVDGVGDVVEAAGEVVFEVGGVPQRMVAFSDDDAGSLWLLFADATSGETTYTCRQLQVEAPAADGSLRIDFNRATNPPCAYTPYSTCPLPPAQNRLTVRIEAGERLPADRAG